MSEQTAPPAADTTETPAAPHAPRPNLIARMNITQMTLVVVIALFLWQWFDSHRQIDNLKQTVAQQLTDMESSNKATQLLMTQQQEILRELSGKVALQEARYAETQSQRDTLETLYQELSGSRDDMAMAQAEQLLLLAEQQLQLAANPKAALIAMQQADDYLKRADRPSQTGLRKRIAADMDTLRALPNVDLPELGQHIDELIAMVDSLPLAQDAPPPRNDDTPAPAADASASGWQKLAREIWQDTRQLVRIEHTDQADPALLMPSQAFFLRENLKMRLLSARTALLIRDETSYKHDLQEAQTWLKHYFDARSGNGAAALAILQKLREPGIRIELPDISGSLEAVRAWRATHGKPAQ
ncbi:MAG: uroporphyrinogen-III C-methyltransferase [Gallionellaceae bacterium]|jgi:uroporphyrin-3 C-methyltransferase|nr:uroporphyrinogen-III C-methyltransferase [Gallionellaceae bacterium]